MKSPNAHMLLLVLLLSASSAVLSTEEPFSYMALGGLKEVTVRVDGIHRDFSRFGLTADALKKATEEKLNANGINVVTSETAQSDPSVGRLRIKLNANENQYRFYHYGINLQLLSLIHI